MKPRRTLLLKLLICFVLLYFLQNWIIAGYHSILQFAGALLHGAAGEKIVCDDSCTLRIIAFLSLMLSTAGVRFGYRLFALLAGLLVFVGIDLAGFYLGAPTPPFSPASSETFFQLLYGTIWKILTDLLLPVLLWITAFGWYPGVLSGRPLEVDEALDRPSFSKS